MQRLMRISAILSAIGFIALTESASLRRKLQSAAPPQSLWSTGSGGAVGNDFGGNNGGYVATSDGFGGGNFNSNNNNNNNGGGFGSTSNNNNDGYVSSSSGGNEGGGGFGMDSQSQHNNDGGSSGFGASNSGFGDSSVSSSGGGFGSNSGGGSFSSGIGSSTANSGFDSGSGGGGNSMENNQQQQQGAFSEGNNGGSSNVNSGGGFSNGNSFGESGGGFGSGGFQQGQQEQQQQQPPQQEHSQSGSMFGGESNNNNNGNQEQSQPPPQQQQQQQQQPPQQEQQQPQQQQQQQQQQPQQQGHPQAQANGVCNIPREPEEIDVTPSWTAAFPGSGIKFLWQTIEQLTGIYTSDDNDTNGRLKRGTAVTVKSHFPSTHVSPKFFYMDTSRLQHAVLLVRNPLYVLPSYFKFLYRYEFNNGPDAEVPIDRWVAWRNEHYEEQLGKWVEHTQWWLRNYGSNGKLMILPFEHFVDPEKGPEALKQIGIFLGQVDETTASHLVPEEQLGCLWQRTVGKSTPPGFADPKFRKRMQQQPPKYPFTIEQLDHMITTVKNLKKEFASVPQLHDTLGEYMKQITQAKRTVQKLLDS